ncbi:ABC transporter permease [Puia dinghuensis]|uniref:ABC transporter permease n=1 Tax=Puia dinghuensis TaxID=1792502 RepID=A0A8J2UGW0_9BACT|nr:ABC transporter permease [Puia dinghuensis]GGB15923.1 ABC transporter permease [Puia dinghuensis]
MLTNFFTIALRNLLKHKIFSIINIAGLAIGMAAALLIFQYVRFELSYDKFEAHAADIYRIQMDRYNEGKLSTRWAAGTAGIGPVVKDAFPEVTSLARLYDWRGVMSYQDKEFREENMYFANDGFLPMFSSATTQGSITGALSNVNTAVLTTSAARKYFGSENPIGKNLLLNKKEPFTVTAVVPDPPANTHLKFNILLSWPTWVKWVGDPMTTQWGWDGFFAYIQLRPGADPHQLEKKIPAVIQAKWGEEMKKSKEGIVVHLQSLGNIHLSPNYMLEAEANGDGKAVKFLSIIALFIIAIAWINYINLSTARSIERAKEVGIRKTLGSIRRDLIGQFLFESFLINSFAVILALLLILACLPIFNAVAGQSLNLSMLSTASFWSMLIGIFLVGTVLSGLYPAFVLSSFKPIAVLKGRLATTSHGSLLRQTLVIGQFAASVLLMVGTFTVYRQLNYMQHQDLGVQITQTLVLKGPRVMDSTYDNKLTGFRDEVLRVPGVNSISASTEVPGHKVGWNAGGIKEVGADATKARQYRVIGVDYDFATAFGMHFLAGRNFSRDFRSDTGAVLFNESAVKNMGFNKPEDVLNKRIDFWGKQYTIVGVVSNHHQESLRESYDAHIFRLIPDANTYYSLKLTGSRDSWPATITAVKTQYKSFFPGNPFDYFFLDDRFAEQYKADQQFGETFGIFAGLAIFVSCLGLLGLAAFVTNQRTKEIGIRKIAGASVGNILSLLTRDFMRPVLLSFLIAIPLTWYALEKWLDNYAFRISLTPLLFIGPALLILAIALLTVTTQTLKAANTNPARSLRTE